MNSSNDLNQLLRNMEPELNEGAYVFCSINDAGKLDMKDVLFFFREQEGVTLVLKKELADEFGFSYSFVASWITLTVHSSLEAVGLTAAFSKALSDEAISCNVAAACFHDHIFVPENDAQRALAALKRLSASS